MTTASQQGTLALVLMAPGRGEGYSSLNGVVSASSFDTSKILDAEVLTKYCHTCSTAKGKAKPHFLNKNFKGTSGAMEVFIWQKTMV